MALLVLTTLSAISGIGRAQYTATYLPNNVPAHTEEGQIGTNQLLTKKHAYSQNLYINSVEDFCLWAPPYSDGKNSSIGEVEEIVVSWCVKAGYGTRLIPDGTLKGAHFVQTPDYVQVTGWGDFTKMNIPKGDAGGELDPHGADGLGNPHGGLVFGNSFGKLQQYHEWTNFMSSTEFCVRACKDGPNAAKICNHIYDIMGCEWNMPGNYAQGVFENCMGDSSQPMGIYGSSTFHQGDPSTPQPHAAPKSSSCTSVSSVGNAGITTSSLSTLTTPPASSSTSRSGQTSASPTTSTANGARRLASSDALILGGTMFAAGAFVLGLCSVL
ncbi:carbohydrate-binding module family 13 protein [Rhizoctonia solani AG-1 IA]|uniref:Carbohydrate-binding module family 13 protein n=2 Tax=Rhizoctonia solani TaxID=456999 RepID=L8X203_THACA|nr:carbohydrate-binding module family 13 protein [Rhizoctonia solani AG-1 IA]